MSNSTTNSLIKASEDTEYVSRASHVLSPPIPPSPKRYKMAPPLEQMDTHNQDNPPAQMPQDITLKSLYEMLTDIKSNTVSREHLERVEELITNVTNQAENDATTVADLTDKLEKQELAYRVVIGRLTEANRHIRHLEEQMTDMQARSMRDNIIIRSKKSAYKETRDEKTEVTFKNFARDELKIPPILANKIKITRSHRMGKGENRPIIAKVINDDDHKRLFGAAKALEGTNSSISKQLPPAVEERRLFGWPEYKKAKADGKNAKWDPSGKLFIEGDHAQRIDPVTLPEFSSYTSCTASAEVKVALSDPVEKNGHKFRAIAANAQSLQAVRECKDYIIQSTVLSSVKHMPFSFRFQSDDNGIKENFDSDQDTFAGLDILKAMRKSKANDKVVFVAHWVENTSGHMNGKERADIICSATQQALAALAENTEG